MSAHPHRHYFRLVFASLFLLQTACQPSLASPSPLTILPANCEVTASGQIGLTLNGDIDPGAQVNWKAERGSIVENGRGFSATYFAPAEPGEDAIAATVAPALSGGSETLSVTCRILGGAGQTPFGPTPFPPSLPTVVISEVMGNPCGGVEFKKYNQYIELYNYGDLPVDVYGWFFFDEGESGTPDMIVPWVSRSTTQLNASLVTNSAVIPPR
ncbi:MAG: lamin tail domain-containing protein, partial [Chloroflexota bacterium]